MLVQLALAWIWVGSVVAATPLAVVDIGKNTYSYDSLVGHGLWPSDARDQYGDTAGGWGSGVAADLSTWKKNKDGSYGGIIYTIPDRGWNTNGNRNSWMWLIVQGQSITKRGYTSSM
jgi:hypothetical protein